MKPFAESQVTINQVIACEDIKVAKLDFQVDKNNTQKVPLNEAILNVKGLIAYELKDTASAKEAFEEAVKISPDFVLAKQNAEALEVELTKK